MNEATNKEVRIATYNERKYRLLYLGNTKFGQRAQLAFLDGSKEFWVDAEKVQVHADGQTLAEVKKPTAAASQAGGAATSSGTKESIIPPGTVVEYKGHKYKLQWAGTTKFGYRAILQYLDGSREFWADGSAVITDEMANPKEAEPSHLDEQPTPRFSATPKTKAMCSLCREAPAEIEHPEYAGDMICGGCYLTFGAPF